MRLVAGADLDVGAQDVTLLGSSLHRFDGAVAVAKLINRFVDLRLGDVDLITRRTQRLVLTKLDDGLEGYRCGKDQGLVAHKLDGWLSDRRDFFLLEDLGVDLGNKLMSIASSRRRWRPSCFSIRGRGALPGRKPGIWTRGASFL